MICEMCGEDRKHRAHGLCTTCYNRVRTVASKMTGRPLSRRFKTTVYLDQGQNEALKTLAETRSVTAASLIRAAIDVYLKVSSASK